MPEPVKFIVEVDPRSISRMSEAQLAELAKRVQKVLGGKPKDGDDPGPGKPKKGPGGKLAGSLLGTALPIGRLASTALAAGVAAPAVAMIAEVGARAAGDFIQKMLPQRLNGLLKFFGVDKESIGKDIGSAAAKLREQFDLQIARVAAASAGLSAGTRLAKAAGGIGQQGALTTEHAAQAALVAYESSMLDAEVRNRANRRAERRVTKAVLDGLSENFSKFAGIGR